MLFGENGQNMDWDWKCPTYKFKYLLWVRGAFIAFVSYKSVFEYWEVERPDGGATWESQPNDMGIRTNPEGSSSSQMMMVMMMETSGTVQRISNMAANWSHLWSLYFMF